MELSPSRRVSKVKVEARFNYGLGRFGMINLLIFEDCRFIFPATVSQCQVGASGGQKFHKITTLDVT